MRDEPAWLPDFVSELLEILDQAGLPPAEVQTRLQAGEDLRDMVRSVGQQDRVFIGIGLLGPVTQKILRGTYAAN